MSESQNIFFLQDARQLNAVVSTCGKNQSEPADVFGLFKKSPRSMSVSDSKLVPPPSPPALLMATGQSPMNPPLLPPPRFQSPPSQKNRSMNQNSIQP